MEQKSYTRVTLTLDIIRKITHGPNSGYHELSIIKHQIDLYDVITVAVSNTMSLSCNVEGVPCTPENLCWQAALLLKKRFNIDKNIHIDIQKNIPVMGGLAGGSSNAATMIMLLNSYWDLGLSVELMINLGRDLGMDVPFYFYGKTAFDSEATAVLYPIPTKNRYTFILALPDFGVSTKAAYSGVCYEKIGMEQDKSKKLLEMLQNNRLENIGSLIHNDFEYSVFQSYPRLCEIKQELLAAGCDGAILTGSGSTMIGVVPDGCDAQRIANSFSCRTIVAHTL